MANIITARQALKANGGANIANCPTLKHAILPYGRQSSLVDYVTGLHRTSMFTAHGDGWSTANTASGAALAAGSAWFTPGTANFCVHVVAKFASGGGIQAGDTIANGGFNISAGSGMIKSSIGTVQSINSAIEAGLANGYTLSRIGSTSLEARKNGSVTETVTGDPGNITTVDADIGLYSCSEFYGAYVFQFSGEVPSNYVTVLHEITTRRLAGDWRLPIEIADWT